jgi:hypothetical protein
MTFVSDQGISPAICSSQTHMRLAAIWNGISTLFSIMEVPQSEGSYPVVQVGGLSSTLNPHQLRVIRYSSRPMSIARLQRHPVAARGDH